MSSYIHFTEEQKQRAAAVNLEEFLRCRGEKLLSSGREKRLASDHSVTVRGNEWYDHAEERGGHAVSFVQRFYGLSYPDAVTMLLGGELGTAYPSAGEHTEEPAKPFVLPPPTKICAECLRISSSIAASQEMWWRTLPRPGFCMRMPNITTPCLLVRIQMVFPATPTSAAPTATEKPSA